MMKISCRLALWVVCLLGSAASIAQPARPPSEDEIQGIMTLCGGGRSKQFSAQVMANFREWRKGVAQGKASLSADSIAAVFTKIDIGGEELMKIYTACVKDQTKMFLETNAGRLDEKYRSLATVPRAALLVETQWFTEYIRAIETSNPMVPPTKMTPYEFPRRRLFDDRGRWQPHETSLSSTGCSVMSQGGKFNIYFPANLELGTTLRQCYRSEEMGVVLRQALSEWQSLPAERFETLQLLVGKPISAFLTDCAESRTDIPKKHLGRITVDWQPDPSSRSEDVDSLMCHLGQHSPRSWSDPCNGGDAGATAFDHVKTNFVLGGQRTTDRNVLRTAFQTSLRSAGISQDSEVGECLIRSFNFLLQ